MDKRDPIQDFEFIHCYVEPVVARQQIQERHY
jgi:hypothetical protein